jgi:hypothetical protein
MGPIGSANDLDFSAGRWMSASGALASFRRLERIAASDPLRKFGIFSEPMEKLHVAKRAQRFF